ncbi:MAG: hypothetical protein ACO3NZ_12960, partial [Pirellulales bacterium]
THGVANPGEQILDEVCSKDRVLRAIVREALACAIHGPFGPVEPSLPSLASRSKGITHLNLTRYA